MKKHILSVMVAVAMMAPSAMKAQIYISDDVDYEYENPRVASDEWSGLVVPLNASDADQYLPLGEGWLLLAGLGGAYLLRKRKKENNGF
jgi:MYXO-CTERM domain-containing protein